MALLQRPLDDAVLAGLFGARRVFVAPCHSCTGVATKVVTALRHGIPVVCTSEATRGITDGLVTASGGNSAHHAGGLSVHDEPHKFAAAIAALLTDDALWRRRSEAALHYARTELSVGILDVRMATLLGTLAARRCAAGDAQAARACQYAETHPSSSGSDEGSATRRKALSAGGA